MILEETPVLARNTNTLKESLESGKVLVGVDKIRHSCQDQFHEKARITQIYSVT